MQMFFETPFMFWYGFVFSFLICTGAGALIQCWFLINFCNLKSKKIHYIIYMIVCYAQYWFAISIDISISPLLDTLLGVSILFVFLTKILKQTYIISAIAATLTMAAISLVESMMFLLNYLAYNTMEMAQTIAIGIDGLLFFVISLVIFKFLVTRYRIKSCCKANYLLAFSVPIFFISIVLRTVNHITYTLGADYLIIESDRIQNHELVILTVIAFLCICMVLFAYEKITIQIDSENERILLHSQISIQKNYVAEAKLKYETTKAFRHDFTNHIIALRGLIKLGYMEKASAYMDSFEQINQAITFPVDTGNSVVDILLSEKLSYARQMGIHTKCDVTVPHHVKINDFDLCAIFSNTIDNAIKACNRIQNVDKIIDIVAKPNMDFFIIDMINNYETGHVPKGSGVGLSTVHIMAEKYHGAVEISDTDNLFRISIILPFAE